MSKEKVVLQMASAVPRIEARGFGQPRIFVDGNLILSTAWGSAKAREMFIFMLFSGQPMHKEKIIEAIWPETYSSKANSNFHSTLHRMKMALYPNCVERDGELYQLNPLWQYWLDARDFEKLVQEGEQLSQDDEDRERLLSSAIDLYTGPFLEDMDSEWSNQQRTNLEFKFWKAISSLVDLYESKGEIQRSIALLEKGLSVDDLQEEAYYKMMDLYLEIGDVASARRVYKRCVSILGETLPISESPKVSKLLAHLN